MNDTAKRIAAAIALAGTIATGAEGLKLTPYYDPPGILTVCRGHTGPDVIKDKKYSLDECNAFLTADMKKAVAKVESCHPGLPSPVLAAFADATYNMGPKIACNRKKSTAARMLDAGNIKGACDELLRWNKAKVLGVMTELGGLNARRKLDREVCLQGVDS